MWGENTGIKVNAKNIGPQVTGGTEQVDFDDVSRQVGREDKNQETEGDCVWPRNVAIKSK